jgi:hypothetical protein
MKAMLATVNIHGEVSLSETASPNNGACLSTLGSVLAGVSCIITPFIFFKEE